MTIIYQEMDGDLNHLANRMVAVIGYGALGQPAALNLRDSGVNTLVGGNADEQAAAQLDGFNASGIADAVRNSNIIMVMLPDESMTPVYMSAISPNLKRHDTLIFSSAYNLAFGYIEAPPFVDVGLIAPRTVGGILPVRYASDNRPFRSFVAVGQDASRQAWDRVLSLALALGALRGGAMEISLEQEAEISLFIQQAIQPALYHMLFTAASLLIDRGYPPEAVFTDLYLSGRLNEYMRQAAQSGLMEALNKSSMTGQYGTLTRLERYNDLKLERIMEKMLEEIHEKDFAQEWSKEYADGFPRLSKLLKYHRGHELWEFEQQTIEMQPPEDQE